LLFRNNFDIVSKVHRLDAKTPSFCIAELRFQAEVPDTKTGSKGVKVYL